MAQRGRIQDRLARVTTAFDDFNESMVFII